MTKQFAVEDWSGAHFHDVDFSGARVRRAWVIFYEPWWHSHYMTRDRAALRSSRV